MQRRKFLIGLGALAAGSGAAMGTGAFTSASVPERQMNVAVDADDESTIALVPGDDPDVSIDGDGELSLDLDGADGQGVNINSRYTWGDPDNPSDSHAFKIVNNDDEGKSYAMKMEYHFDDISWLDERQGQSFIKFQLFDSAGRSPSQTYPEQGNNWNKDYPLGGPGDDSPVGDWRFTPGEEWYVVVTVDTTGEHASVDDDLSGDATFHFSDGDEPSIGGWNDGW
jgi:hypothetical protein